MERVGIESAVHKQATQNMASVCLKMNCMASKIFIRILFPWRSIPKLNKVFSLYRDSLDQSKKEAWNK